MRLLPRRCVGCGSRCRTAWRNSIRGGGGGRDRVRRGGLASLRKAGAQVGRDAVPGCSRQMIAANPKGGFPVPEAFGIRSHRQRLAERGDEVDPHVRARISRGR